MNIDLSKARIGMIACWILVVLLYVLYLVSEAEFLLFIAMVPVIGSVFFNFFNRCPCCGHWLGRHHVFIEYCPYCGGYL